MILLHTRPYATLAALSLSFLIAAATADAQEASTPDRARELSAEAATRLRQTKPNVQIDIDRRTGFPKTVRGLSAEPRLQPFSVPAHTDAGESPAFAPSAAPVDADAAHAPNANAAPAPNAANAAENFFDSGLGRELYPRVSASEGVRALETKNDPDFPGSTVVEVQQTYGNLDVLFARAKVNVEPSANVSGVTASFTPLKAIPVQPAINETNARDLARAEYQRLLTQMPDGPEAQVRVLEGDTPAEAARLVVFDPKLVDAGTGSVRLAWLVEIGNARLVLDANNGKVLYFYHDAPSVLSQRIFDFANSMVPPASPIVDDAAPGANTQVNSDVGLARDNTQAVYDFFYARFDRDGFDDNDGAGPAGGSPFISYVRLAGLANALWCPRPARQCPAKNVMVYGSGYAAALDIVAHEIGHGVIAHEADLAYRGESGALNESIADIFGALVEPEGSSNWIIGESLPMHSAVHPLRDMRDPGSLGFDPHKPFGPGNTGQPDHYLKLVKFDPLSQTGDTICKFSSDSLNGCVHFNSGIVNKAVWFLAEGGQNEGVTVQGIGRDKLGRIVYRTLLLGLTQTSGLRDFAAAMVQSCADLASASVTTAADCDSTRAAFQSVGLVPTS